MGFLSFLAKTFLFIVILFLNVLEVINKKNLAIVMVKTYLHRPRYTNTYMYRPTYMQTHLHTCKHAARETIQTHTHIHRPTHIDPTCIQGLSTQIHAYMYIQTCVIG